MVESCLNEEVTELYHRIIYADASILRCKSLIAALHESGQWSGREEFNLRTLIEQKNGIGNLLTALLWCRPGRNAAEPLMDLAA